MRSRSTSPAPTGTMESERLVAKPQARLISRSQRHSFACRERSGARSTLCLRMRAAGTESRSYHSEKDARAKTFECFRI